MNEKTDATSDALLDGLVFARGILWLQGNPGMLNLLAHRFQLRYGVNIWELRSPVEGDNAFPSNGEGTANKEPKQTVQQSSDRTAACAAIKRARISLDNAARGFDKGCDDAVIGTACQESMKWMETAVANLTSNKNNP